ncbi:hypothetical protein CPB86DRAFT_741369 [Serendipita vermifera]|nr:hypothetical protein CPB86DRAFT_741369 [Serendipita vermifera]
MMNVGYIYDGRGTSYRTNAHNKAAAFSFSSRQRRHGRQHHYNHHHHPPVMQDHQQQQTEPVRPPNADPEKLMALLKSSGEYDRLRKQIFTTFQNSEMRKVLLSRVDGVATECLEKDPDVLSRPPDATHADLMRELDTYPFVERQVLCVPIWRDDEWIAHIERSILNLIHDRPVDAPALTEPPVVPPKPQPTTTIEPPKPPRVVVAPWRIKETAPVFVPNEIDEGLGEDDMAIDDD